MAQAQGSAADPLSPSRRIPVGKPLDKRPLCQRRSNPADPSIDIVTHKAQSDSGKPGEGMWLMEAWFKQRAGDTGGMQKMVNAFKAEKKEQEKQEVPTEEASDVPISSIVARVVRKEWTGSVAASATVAPATELAGTLAPAPPVVAAEPSAADPPAFFEVWDAPGALPDAALTTTAAAAAVVAPPASSTACPPEVWEAPTALPAAATPSSQDSLDATPPGTATAAPAQSACSEPSPPVDGAAIATSSMHESESDDEAPIVVEASPEEMPMSTANVSAAIVSACSAAPCEAPVAWPAAASPASLVKREPDFISPEPPVRHHPAVYEVPDASPALPPQVIEDHSEEEDDAKEDEPKVPTSVPAWRIEVNATRQQRTATPRGARAADGHGAAAWRSNLLERVTPGVRHAKQGGPAEAWSHWVSAAENFAERHVREKFGRLAKQLTETQACGGDGDIRALLAFAGADTADHEATMRLSQQLVREKFRNACVARVTPEDFKSLGVVKRLVMEQLMQGAGSYSGGGRHEGDVEDTDFGESSSEEEQEGDFGGQPGEVAAMPVRNRSAMDFADWQNDSGRKSSGLTVLFVERMEAVPKEALRDLLMCFGATCAECGVPLVVVFGLQQPPQSRFDFLEGELLMPLRVVDAMCLFDVSAVVGQVLEYVVEKPEGLPLAPNLLLWLRAQFMSGRRSLSATLRTLGLLCQQQLLRKPLARWCAQALCEEGGRGNMNHLDTCMEAVPSARIVFPDLSEEHRSDAAFRKKANPELLAAAYEVMMWRDRLCTSLKVWDVLVTAAAPPLLRREARFSRLLRLLQAIWPQAAKDDDLATSCEGWRVRRMEDKQAEEEDKAVNELLEETLRPLRVNSAETLQLEELRALHKQLCVAVSEVQDTHLKKELASMNPNLLKKETFRAKLSKWVDNFRETIRPLTGAKRRLLLECAASQEELMTRVELQLSGSRVSHVERLLEPLSSFGQTRRYPGLGKRRSLPMEDVAFLWRLLQASMGKSVWVSELWRKFSDYARTASGQQETGIALHRRRFGQALSALHAMGLHMPRMQAAAASSSAKGSGWRLQKRHSGRVWRGAKVRPPQPVFQQERQEDPVDKLRRAAAEAQPSSTGGKDETMEEPVNKLRRVFAEDQASSIGGEDAQGLDGDAQAPVPGTPKRDASALQRRIEARVLQRRITPPAIQRPKRAWQQPQGAMCVGKKTSKRVRLFMG